MASIASYENPKVIDASSLVSGTTILTDDIPYTSRIALVGKMHAGKSTVARKIAEARYTPVAFADEVKAIAAVAANAIRVRPSIYYPAKTDIVTQEDIDKRKSVYRPLLQFIGTYGREQISQDIWIKIFKAKYLTGGKEMIVIEDMRFPNEANALRTSGFLIVKIERPEANRKDSIAREFVRQHGRDPKKKELKEIMNADSESFVDDIKPDIIIQNNSSLSNLQAAANRVVNKPTLFNER